MSINLIDGHKMSSLAYQVLKNGRMEDIINADKKRYSESCRVRVMCQSGRHSDSSSLYYKYISKKCREMHSLIRSQLNVPQTVFPHLNPRLWFCCCFFANSSCEKLSSLSRLAYFSFQLFFFPPNTAFGPHLVFYMIDSLTMNNWFCDHRVQKRLDDIFQQQMCCKYKLGCHINDIKRTSSNIGDVA